MAACTVPTHLPLLETASLARRVADLETAVAALRASERSGLALFVTAGDLEPLLAAFNVAVAAAALGEGVEVFLAFWAVAALRRPEPALRRRGWLDRLFGWLVPKGARRIGLGRMHFAGAGTRMMRHRMRHKGLCDLPEVLEMAAEAGVRVRVCSQTLDLMGLETEDLVRYPGLEACGAAAFVEIALASRATLFV